MRSSNCSGGGGGVSVDKDKTYYEFNEHGESLVSAPLPSDEEARLSALRRYRILDTPPEVGFDRIARLAVRLFDVPIALVTLVDANRQWFKACYGLDIRQTGRQEAFCAYTILSDEVMVVPDAMLDARFVDNTLVTGSPHIRFYAGAPLKTSDGFFLGSLCIIDTRPRTLTQEQQKTLADLAALVVDELELRQASQELRAEIVERESAEEALRQSELRARSLIENVSDIVSILEPTGVIRYESPSIERTLGYTPEELVGRNAFEFVHPEDVEGIQQSFALSVAEQSNFSSAVFRWRHKDGSWRTLEALGKNLIGGSSDGGVVISSRDITERKQVEEALRESEQRTRLLIESVTDYAIYQLDTEGRIVSWNAGAERIKGYKADYIIGEHFSRFYTAEDVADGKPQHALHEAASKNRYEAEGWRVRQDGSRFWANVVVSALRDEAGDLRGFAKVTRDMTMRHEAEEQLRLSALRVTNILESIGEAFFSLDKEWRFTYINDQAERILRRTREELSGQILWKEFSPIIGTRFEHEYLKAVETNTPTVFEEFFPPFDAWFEIHAYPSEEGLSVFFQDITARKETEQALQVAKDEAERANRAKSEFLSRMSHELRTPLNGILGFAQVLQMHTLPPAQKEIVNDIHDAGKHLFALINEVLDISRIETDGLSFSIEPVELREVARASINLIAPSAVARNIRIVSELEGCAHHVSADRQRLSQCLLNLLSNAVKYNRDGGTITVCCEDADENCILIKIVDTGVGIPPDKITRLFTPFDRLGAETTGVEGTGLGLALTKRLVEAMNGILHFESTEEAGSTFSIELPRADSPLAQLAKTGELDLEEISPSDGNHTVLYIEDNLQNLKVIQLVLAQRPGVKMLSAMQGGIGLELATRHHPDIILLDLNLPDLPGAEVLRRLRENPATRDVPVIVLSADATPGQITRLLQAGARDYLTKPLDVRQFLEVLDELLAGTEVKSRS